MWPSYKKLCINPIQHEWGEGEGKNAYAHIIGLIASKLT